MWEDVEEQSSLSNSNQQNIQIHFIFATNWIKAQFVINVQHVTSHSLQGQIYKVHSGMQIMYFSPHACN